MRKRISLLTVETLPWWLRLFGVLIGASADAGQHQEDSFCGIPKEEIVGSRSLTEIAFTALVGTEPAQPACLPSRPWSACCSRTGRARSRPRAPRGRSRPTGSTPERVQLNKALIGFLTHSGYAHGGNGYEGIAFLIEQFQDADLADPGDPDHGIDLSALARRYAAEYATYRRTRRQPAAWTSGRSRREPPGVQGQAGEP